MKHPTYARRVYRGRGTHTLYVRTRGSPKPRVCDILCNPISMESNELHGKYAFRNCTQSVTNLTYALLFRGEAYRYGCDRAGMHVQDTVMHSHQRMLVEPLEECGATVDIFLAVDTRGCANFTLRERLKSSFQPARLRRYVTVKATSQPTNVRQSLNLYLPLAHEYDVLIFTRYDLRLLQPYRAWPGCQGADRIGVASRCELIQWNQWNCSSDILFFVPRAHLVAFNASIGAPLRPVDSRTYRTRGASAKVAPKACFASKGESVSKGVPMGLGHGCFNSFASRIGADNIDFCFPSSRAGVSEKRNDFYQCCKHGHAAIGSTKRSFENSTHPMHEHGVHVDHATSGMELESGEHLHRHALHGNGTHQSGSPT